MGNWIAGLLALMACCPGALHASDLAREARIAEQIVDAIMEGDPLQLEAGGHRFLAITMAPEHGPARGAALILHGRGLHPDWETVVKPLRTGLAESGWHTLAIQLPVLDREATYYDYLPVLAEAGPRIDAALAHLAAQGYPRPAIVAHSCGVHMAMHWLETRGDDARISAFVGVGMGATDHGQPMRRAYPLDRLRIPVLDIYGGNDYPSVKATAMQRRAAIQRAGHPHSRQQVLEGADHYARQKSPALLDAIRNWLADLH